MKLPNGDKADVPLRKLLHYLLSPTHPVGRSKAKYFRSKGFNDESVETLRKALLMIAASEQVEEVVSTAYGVKYVIDGTLTSPTLAVLRIRTIGVMEEGVQIPRFVTAYPME
jgi:hypothetical protein